jgi:hypothetical protein
MAIRPAPQMTWLETKNGSRNLTMSANGVPRRSR